MEESGDLLDLDQSLIMPPEVVESLRNVTSIGEKVYLEYLLKRIITQEVAFMAPIKQCRLKLFKYGLSVASEEAIEDVWKTTVSIESTLEKGKMQQQHIKAMRKYLEFKQVHCRERQTVHISG